MEEEEYLGLNIEAKPGELYQGVHFSKCAITANGTSFIKCRFTDCELALIVDSEFTLCIFETQTLLKEATQAIFNPKGVAPKDRTVRVTGGNGTKLEFFNPDHNYAIYSENNLASDDDNGLIGLLISGNDILIRTRI